MGLRKVKITELNESVQSFLNEIRSGGGVIVEDESGRPRYGVSLYHASHSRDEELRQRRNVVQQIDALRDRLLKTCGEMPDSVDLVREDRAR